MDIPKQVKIVEVSPRDGLQNEPNRVPTPTKIELINRLSDTGLPVIEVTSFVSPKWIPQLDDSSEVFTKINKKEGVSYPVLVPNIKGLERALEVGVKEIAVFTTSSEQFSQHNTNCSVAESLERIAAIMTLAKQRGIRVRAYLSCVLGCPYEGEISPESVAALAEKLLKQGCFEISLGDTIGVGTPLKTKQLIEKVKAKVPVSHLAVHFHDTYGQAIANIFAALELGVAVIDSSVGGLGGCPYAKGASGNVATEDVLFMLEGMDIKTGVNLEKVIAVSKYISQQLDRQPTSKVSQAFHHTG